MKKIIYLLFVFLASNIPSVKSNEGGGKKSRKSSGRRNNGNNSRSSITSTGNVGIVNAVVNAAGISNNNPVNSVNNVVTSDQQFLQNQLFGMQKEKTDALKNKISDISRKILLNKNNIDNAVSLMMSNPVVMYTEKFN